MREDFFGKTDVFLSDCISNGFGFAVLYEENKRAHFDSSIGKWVKGIADERGGMFFYSMVTGELIGHRR